MSSEPILLALAGAQGRMGRAVEAAARARNDLALVGGFDRADGDAQRAQREAVIRAAAVIVDFTTAAASAELAALCAGHGGPRLVIGSTGFDAAQDAAIRAAAERIAIVRAGNFSLGVNLLIGLVRQAARALPAGAYDIEVLEAHHRRKVDAPSGTALMLGEAAAAGRGVALSDVAERGRDGIGEPRRQGAIGFASLRGGGVVGEHSVLFAAEDELITLAHSARDRSLFARGALEAAVWVADKPPGLYDMQDVLGGWLRA
jgi:4-hydroxy-tetrahydrodipicolinate reductase